MTISLNKALPKEISLLRRMSQLAGPDTINLGLGKPHIDMPPELRQLAISVLKTSSLEYSENAGFLSVRQLLGSRLGFSADQLILTHGAQEALMAAFFATLNPGDEVLVPDPGFPAYATMAKLLRAKPVTYKLKNINSVWVHDFQEIKNKTSSRTKLLVLSSPGNPTGLDLDFVELEKFLQKTKKLRVLSDEVYGMLHFSKPYKALARLNPRIISIGSFSKSHALTGWRMGYLACQDSALRLAALVAHQYFTTCASVPAQHLMGEILQDDQLFLGIPDSFRKLYQNKLKLFLNQFGGDHRSMPSGGFFIFLPLPSDQSNSLLFSKQLLKKENILCIPGVAFGKAGQKYLRLSLAVSDQAIINSAKGLKKYY